MSGNNELTVLDKLEIESEIRKLMNFYSKISDAFKWEEWSECFTEDSLFDFPTGFGTLNGRKEILEVCKGNMDHVYSVMQHYIVNVDVDVISKDKATGTGNLIFVGIPNENKPTEYYQSGGRYSWEFKKTPEGWLIAHTVLNFLWNNGQDVSSVFDKQ